MSRKIPNAAAMGRVGGKKRFDQVGSDGMRKIGAKGNDAIRAKYAGTDFFKQRSLKAQEARLRKQKERKEAEKEAQASPLDKITNLFRGK